MWSSYGTVSRYEAVFVDDGGEVNVELIEVIEQLQNKLLVIVLDL